MTKMFSALKYRAIDYAYEASTIQKLNMGCLFLPVPYHRHTDHFAHTGRLSDVAFRKPWTRALGNYTCRLVLSGSEADNSTTNGLLANFLNNFSVKQMNGENIETLPTSDPDEAIRLLGDSSWTETFHRAETEKRDPRKLYDDLCLTEEVLLVDSLRQFQKQLPPPHVLRRKLRTLSVVDPLMTSTGDPISEDHIFRESDFPVWSVPFEKAEVRDSEITDSDITELFYKEPLLCEESLYLPVHMESCRAQKPHSILSSWRTRCPATIAPTLVAEKITCMEDLGLDTPAGLRDSMEITAYEMISGSANWLPTDEGSTPLEPPVRSRLQTSMELDPPLTPPCPPLHAQPWLWCPQVQEEPLSPVHRHGLVSGAGRDAMEAVLWKAEKHHHVILSLLLIEPQACEAAVPYDPLPEAVALLGIQKGSPTSDTSRLWSPLIPHTRLISGHLERPETTSASQPFATATAPAEDFLVLDNEATDGQPDTSRDEAFLEGMPKQLSLPGQTGRMTGKALATEEAQPIDRAEPGPAAGSGKLLTFSLPRARRTDCLAPRPQNQDLDPGARRTDCLAPKPQNQDLDPGARRTDCLAPKPQNQDLDPRARTTDCLAPRPQNQDLDPGARRTDCLAPRPQNQDLDPGARRTDCLAPRTQNQDLDPGARRTDCLAPRPQNLDPRARRTDCLAPRPQNQNLDPLHSFMMLRAQQKSQASFPTNDEKLPDLDFLSKEKQKPGSFSVTSEGGLKDTSTKETCGQVTANGTSSSQVVDVPASESQRQAYEHLWSTASLCASSLDDPALWDFHSLSSDKVRFLLKQHEKEKEQNQGELSGKKIPRCRDLALLHLLVTVRDLLLSCDLNTAVDYLVKAKEENAGGCLDQLWTQLRVVQYLAQRNTETNPKELALQQQMRAWVERNGDLKVLVITTVDSVCVRAMLVKSLGQVTGIPVVAVVPEEESSKLDSERVTESLGSCWCVVVCRQHVGTPFPWQDFSLVVEYNHMDSSALAALCRERNISHLTFRTMIPHSSRNPTKSPVKPPPVEQKIPFVLFVTDGLLGWGSLLQTLESTYDMTLLERSYSPALQVLGNTHQYAVIQVDERSAVLIQDMEELRQPAASEQVVMRLIALSLQYSHCWVALHGPMEPGSDEVSNNLSLLYSAVVLFRQKSEELQVKVLIVTEIAELARYISRIAQHAMMSSGRDPLIWLDRDWLSVLPSKEEEWLLSFPCVTPLVAQLMLRRAPGLLWLLGASFTDLQGLLPQVPDKVLKLFSETTALARLNFPSSAEHPAQKEPGRPFWPWASGVTALHNSQEDVFLETSSLRDRLGHSGNEDPFDAKEEVDISGCFGAAPVHTSPGQSSKAWDRWGSLETGAGHLAGNVHHVTETPWTGNVHQVTGNVHHVTETPWTGNVHHVTETPWTGNVHHVTGNVHHVTGNVHHVTETPWTGNVHQWTGKVHHVTGNVHHVTETPWTGNVHHVTGNVHHVTGNVHQGTGNVHQGTETPGTGNVHHVTKTPWTGNVHHVTGNVHHVTGNVHHVTKTPWTGNVHQVTGNVHHVTGNVHHVTETPWTGNVHQGTETLGTGKPHHGEARWSFRSFRDPFMESPRQGAQWRRQRSPQGGPSSSGWAGLSSAPASVKRGNPGGAPGQESHQRRLKRTRPAGAIGEEDNPEVLPDLKKGKLTYERVPGRGDGQTRLTFG